MADQGVASNMRFLFCCGNGATTNRCCCGCSIRLGTQIITFITILLAIANIIVLFISHMSGGIKAAALIYQFIQLSGPILVFIATLKNDFKLAYWGRIIYEVYVILWLTLGFLFGLLWGLVFYDGYGGYYYDEYNTYYYYDAGAGFFVAYFVLWTFVAALYIYFAQVIFSFTKELGLGNMAALDGQDALVILNTPIIHANNNYSPPSYPTGQHHVVVVNTAPNQVVPTTNYQNPVQNLNYSQPIQPVQPIQPITTFTSPQPNPNYNAPTNNNNNFNVQPDYNQNNNFNNQNFNNQNVNNPNAYNQNDFNNHQQ
jgi:hypothetical protein